MKTADKHTYLLLLAENLFISFGLKSVTIDDICTKAGISKKTFYIYFNDKQDLVLQVTCRIIYRLKSELIKNMNSAESVIHELLLQKKIIVNFILFRFMFNSSAIRPFPEAFKMIENFKEDYLKTLFENNLLKGIRLGLYRPDINVKQTTLLHFIQIEMALSNPLYTMETAIEAANLYLHAIVVPAEKEKISTCLV